MWVPLEVPHGLPAALSPARELQLLHFFNGLCLCSAQTGSLRPSGPFSSKTCSKAPKTLNPALKGIEEKNSSELRVTCTKFVTAQASGPRLCREAGVLPETNVRA